MIFMVKMSRAGFWFVVFVLIISFKLVMSRMFAGQKTKKFINNQE